MKSVDDLRATVAKLRSPEGCPWDKEQDHRSIRSQLLEECYETLEAIDEGNDTMLKEELGDVLLHITFHAQLAEERGVFNLGDVAQGINDKLIRRHPHVFGEDKLNTSEEVLKRWDELKKAEKTERTRALDGIPTILPALMHAQEIQKKAAKCGFDWAEVKGVLDKVREEIDELEKDIGNKEKAHEELGDLFFSLVSLARHLKLDAEQSCRDSTAKFIRRFRHAEEAAAKSGKPLAKHTEAELEELWQQAKKQA